MFCHMQVVSLKVCSFNTWDLPFLMQDTEITLCCPFCANVSVVVGMLLEVTVRAIYLLKNQIQHRMSLS